MQTGRRRWGRPTTRPVAHQGPARLCIQDQREAPATQALGTFATARHILGGGPVRPRDVLPRPAAVTPPSSVAGAAWIFHIKFWNVYFA